MRTLRMSRRDFERLEQRIKAANGLERSKIMMRSYDCFGLPRWDHPTKLADDVSMVLNLIVIPPGRYLPDLDDELCSYPADPMQPPKVPPTLNFEEVCERLGMTPPPEPEKTPLAPEPEPLRKPRPGEPGYQRHLHDDEFRRRFGV